MIVDLILDRKDGAEYDAKQFYNELREYEKGFAGIVNSMISFCMDYGTEADVKRELCRYIDINEYKPTIKKYINSVNWI